MEHVDLSRVAHYYHSYILLASQEDLLSAFEKHKHDLLDVLHEIPAEKWHYRYAEGKWTISDLVQHMIDAERVFSYRALRFSRKDQTTLPGFDEQLFAKNSGADNRSKESLIEEFDSVKRSTALLFNSFSEEQLEQDGICNGSPVYVAALGYIIIGHCRHHKKVLLERYLNKMKDAV